MGRIGGTRRFYGWKTDLVIGTGIVCTVGIGVVQRNGLVFAIETKLYTFQLIVIDISDIELYIAYSARLLLTLPLLSHNLSCCLLEELSKPQSHS
jgi:hypothetical protein